MQGASREALAAGADRLDALTSAPGADVAGIADDLSAVATAFGQNARLRRMLTDPARPAAQRADIATALLAGKIGADAAALVAGLARSRWSAPRDLSDSVAALSVRADLAVAERDGKLDEVEDELFRLGRVLDSNGDLALALGDTRVAADKRLALVDGLLGGKVDATTYRLVGRLVANPRGRSISAGLAEVGKAAAERRQRLIAYVKAAVPLTEQQRTRLQAVLKRLYGQEVHLNLDLDPAVLGGLSVRVGDEVIDGTVATRLARVQRQLTS
ncbi:F0F1 ATP synthase subunit delta [Catenulispora yoronensis]|uniref:ATP synthase subunit delta n=1 Tax=Catenulispora yoronensis TaxID=450799 RepID=A0ABN2VN37_9ACTN